MPRLGEAGPPIAPARRPRNRRELIIRAATEQFCRHGYHATSMRDVAREVGVSSTALYRHFASKHDLLVDAVNGGLDATQAAVAELGQAPSTAEIAAALARLAVERRGAAALWQREFRYLSADEQRGLSRRFGVLVDLVTAALGRERLMVESDARFLAWCLLSSMASVSHHHVEVPGLADLLAATGVQVLRTALPAQAAPIPTPRDSSAGAGTVQRLIAAAPAMFVARGFAAVSMEEIGTAVGIAGPSIYHHFGGKADLLAAVVDNAERRLAADLARAAATGGPTQLSTTLLELYVSFAVAHPDLIGVLISETVHLGSEQARQARGVQRDSLARWAAAERSARPELSARQALVIVQAVVTVVNDMARLRLVRDRPALSADLIAVGRAVLHCDGTRE